MKRSNTPAFVVLLSTVVCCGLANAEQDELSSRVLRQLHVADAAVQQGTTAFKRSNGGKFYRFTLRYDPNHRFVLKQEAFSNSQLRGQQTQPEVVQLFDGQDTYLFYSDAQGAKKNYVSIEAGKPEEAGPSYRFSGGLYPGASPLLGRGFSLLGNPTFTTAKNADIILRGEAPDGSIIRATLDPKHEFVAKRVERYRGKQLIQTISLGHPKQVDKVWVASGATCAHNRNGKLTVSDAYSLLQANFSEVPDEVFEARILKGTVALDEREGGQISWNMQTSLSGQKLLQRTQRKTRQLADLKAQAESAQSRQHLVTIGLAFVPLSLLFFIGLRRQQRRRADQAKKLAEKTT